MRLTQIKLAGFKSFTDPTTIHVPGQLVAVIGPNGCGKSNVIDAVRWVLGEASAKQLRGESMQDVIFNGAATRRPAPRASVELVFDNSAHTLKGAWGQYAEVSIKRQLTRQGESSYFINNQQVRRRDITELFLGTGVGARGYAVIEQGMISRIIESRPEELRAYIEEAAGVSKYKERRRETESRLKDAHENLQRLADLRGELVRQVEKLEKQAATAERYRTLTQDLRQAQDLADFVQWQTALKQAAAAEQAREAAQMRLAQADEDSRSLNGQIQNLRENERDCQAQVQNLNGRHALLREQIARLEEQIRALQNQQQRMERERAAAQTAVQKITQEQAQLRSECEDSDMLLEERQVELAELAMAVAECEEKLPEYETAQQQAEMAWHSQQDEANRLRRELALKRQQLAHTEHNLAQQQARQNRLQTEYAGLNLPDEREQSEIQARADNLRSQYGESHSRLQAAEESLGCLKNNVESAFAAWRGIEQEYLTVQAQHGALAQLLGGGKQDFWADTPHAAVPELWQRVRVDETWRHALGVVLAQRLHARAVPDFAPPQPLPQGAAVWLNQQAAAARKTQPANALINQVQAESEFQAALQHWLDGVLCAPDLDYALERQNELQGRQLWLTPQGHCVDKLSVSLYQAEGAVQLIEQQAQCERLAQRLAELEPQLENARSLHAQAQQQLAAQERQVRDWQAESRALAADFQTAQSEAADCLARTNQGQLRREHIMLELAQLAEEAETAAQSCLNLREDSEWLEEALSALETGLNDADSRRQEQNRRYKQAQLALLEANRRYGAAEIELHKQQQRRRTIEQKIADLEQQKTDWSERQAELALVYENNAADSVQREQLEILSEQNLNLVEEIQAASQRLADTQAQGLALFERQQQQAAGLPQLQAAVQDALLQHQQALLNAERFYENLIGREADLDALALADAPSLAQINRQIAELNGLVGHLGAVNLAALEELAEARERDEYYRVQSEDVQKAIDGLEQAIAQIDQDTKARFKETFDAVNGKVQTFFPTLFGGGEAALHMNGDDLLTAGVSIMARPPGKKNSTIHLLSGGEKALTAMSLVFALFSLNPAPFCLLDEVDAPLDDANTARFCNLVKEMSAQTQFLYISHNRLTMEMAEQLIGVTMQEKGVSRIVAVDIQQAMQMAQA